MLELNMKAYRDGNRFVLVFDNCKAETEDLIRGIIGGVMGNTMAQTKEIHDVVPVPAETPEMPHIPEPKPEKPQKTNAFEKSFSEFVAVYQDVVKNGKNLNPEDYAQKAAYINQYAEFLRNLDVRTITDEDLIFVLNYGLDTVFAGRKKDILINLSLTKIEEVYTSGRMVLENAYKICVEKK